VVPMSQSVDFNRSVSHLFSNSVFRQIVETGTSEYLLNKADKYRYQLLPDGKSRIKEMLQQAYQHLAKNYRNEYLYKNTIANNILLGRHSLRTATMLNEFKVAASIADILIINGTSTVYEIKTELDSPEKLLKQVSDYKKAFAKIYIVTHHSLVEKYRKLLSDHQVGLIALSGRFNFKIEKETEEDFSTMDQLVMMKALRKEEYSSIIEKYYGKLPPVSNIHYFKECVRLAQQIDVIIFHELMLQQLAKRKPLYAEGLQSIDLPKELKQICLCINPTPHQYQNLFSFLNKTI
jgi:hypothetical protein